MVLIIVALILLLIGFILFAPLKVTALYQDEELSLKVSLCGIKVYSTKMKDDGEDDEEDDEPEEKSSKAEKFEDDTNELSLKLSGIFDVCKTAVRLLKKYVSVKDVNLKIIVGMGDAATTAITTGALWAAVYNLLGIIGRVVFIDHHNVEITPEYQGEVFKVEGGCIIKSRIAYIIIIAISILFKIKSLKGKEDKK